MIVSSIYKQPITTLNRSYLRTFISSVRFSVFKIMSSCFEDILSAKTYGDTCFMDAELYSSEAKSTYDEALRGFDKLVIPEDDILRAAGYGQK